MYSGNHGSIANAVLHVIGIAPSNTAGLTNYLGERQTSTPQGRGCIDHVAFSPTGLDAILKHVGYPGIDVRERTVPSWSFARCSWTTPMAW